MSFSPLGPKIAIPEGRLEVREGVATPWDASANGSRADSLQHLLLAPGSGLRLFPVREKPIHLRLVSTPRFEKGTVAHVYQPE